jgi:hypothetical protein
MNDRTKNIVASVASSFRELEKSDWLYAGQATIRCFYKDWVHGRSGPL